MPPERKHEVSFTCVVTGSGSTRDRSPKVLHSLALTQSLPLIEHLNGRLVVSNTPGMLRAVGTMMAEMGVKPEIKAFDTGQ